ncbi:MAG: short-chain dehydrogenase [Ponticaulis sp.]|nr:short-chain dehydrogenase [Ponticaulis sp.]|tara:strand:+ start:19615 stop:20433 length:819 start_codon:yes stop_codon:yes gene_type:complete
MGEARGRKSIFITGAASGIGAETARYFARKGWFVGLYDINEAGLAELASDIGTQHCTYARLDVTSRENWSGAIRSFSDCTEKRMNVLFNNAGIGEFGWFEDIAADDSDAIIDINVKGVVNGVYAALPLLRETTGAHILNTASTAGLIGTPRLAVYSASKFAVRGLSEALNLELADQDICVSCLMPWFVDTPILNGIAAEGSNRNVKDDLVDSGIEVYPVSMVADKVWEAVHGKAPHYMVGKAAERTRFASRFLPGLVRKRLRRSLPKRRETA